MVNYPFRMVVLSKHTQSETQSFDLDHSVTCCARGGFVIWIRDEMQLQLQPAHWSAATHTHIHTNARVLRSIVSAVDLDLLIVMDMRS